MAITSELANSALAPRSDEALVSPQASDSQYSLISTKLEAYLRMFDSIVLLN